MSIKVIRKAKANSTGSRPNGNNGIKAWRRFGQSYPVRERLFRTKVLPRD
jgi:hypothetical protein